MAAWWSLSSLDSSLTTSSIQQKNCGNSHIIYQNTPTIHFPCRRLPPQKIFTSRLAQRLVWPWDFVQGFICPRIRSIHFLKTLMCDRWDRLRARGTWPQLHHILRRWDLPEDFYTERLGRLPSLSPRCFTPIRVRDKSFGHTALA